MINKNQKPKSQSQLIHQLTQARTAQKTPKAAKNVKPVAQQPDLMRLPPIERLTAARKLAKKQQKLTVDNAPTPVARKEWELPFPELDESTMRIMEMVAELSAATAAYNEE